MSNLYDLQYRNERSGTTYPFAEQASLTSVSGQQLPLGLFADASLYPVGGVAGLYLSEIVIDNQTVTLYVGNAGQTQLCSASFPVTTPPDNLDLFDNYQRPAGVLISSSEQLAVFQGWGAGDFLFDAAATEFVATVCAPLPEVALRGFLLEDGTLVSGEVWLVGGEGVILSLSGDSCPICSWHGPPMWKLNVRGFTDEWAVLNGDIQLNAQFSPTYGDSICAWESPWVYVSSISQHLAYLVSLENISDELYLMVGISELESQSTYYSYAVPLLDKAGSLDCGNLLFEASFVQTRVSSGTQLPQFTLSSNFTVPPTAQVRVDIVGDPLFRRALCVEHNLFATPLPVKKLQVLAPNTAFTLTPDALGSIRFLIGNTLAEDTVLRLTPGTNALELSAVGQTD